MSIGRSEGRAGLDEPLTLLVGTGCGGRGVSTRSRHEAGAPQFGQALRASRSVAENGNENNAVETVRCRCENVGPDPASATLKHVARPATGGVGRTMTRASPARSAVADMREDGAEVLVLDDGRLETGAAFEGGVSRSRHGSGSQPGRRDNRRRDALAASSRRDLVGSSTENRIIVLAGSAVLENVRS